MRHSELINQLSQAVSALSGYETYGGCDTLVVKMPDNSIIRLRIVGYYPPGICRVCKEVINQFGDAANRTICHKCGSEID